MCQCANECTKNSEFNAVVFVILGHYYHFPVSFVRVEIQFSDFPS